MTPAFNPDNYIVEVTTRMVTGAVLFEGTAVELPGIVVYGTTGTAVLEEVHYELSRWHALTFPDAKRAPEDC